MEITVELSESDSARLTEYASSHATTESELAASLIHDSLDRLVDDADEPSEKTKRLSEYIMEKHRDLMLRLAK